MNTPASCSAWHISPARGDRNTMTQNDIDNGRIVAAKVFRANVPANEMNASSAAAALDQAFGQCATELVEWATGII